MTFFLPELVAREIRTLCLRSLSAQRFESPRSWAGAKLIDSLWVIACSPSPVEPMGLLYPARDARSTPPTAVDQ